MPESTNHGAQLTDETGTPLTDAEIAAVIRVRPLLILVVASNTSHDISVTGTGMQVIYRSDHGLGRITVTRTVIDQAMGEVGTGNCQTPDA